MLRPKDDFWQQHYRRQADYERPTFTAKVTAVYSDAVYDVEVATGLSGGQFYDVNNATGFNFRVGDMVIVARVGGMRGNRHVIIARAGYGGSLPYSPPPAPGGEYDPTESLSEVIAARDSAVYGDFDALDARLEAGDSEVNLARQGYASLSDRIAAKADLSSPQFIGTPRAEKYEVHDGAKYITYDGGGNLALTDAVTGTKTLSELAAGGGGTDTKQVKVSSDDTTEKYLEDAITVSGGVTKSTTSPGGNEKVDLAVHAEDHDHDGSPTQKLTQANTHESADTDAATSSLHHTIGTTATKASAGNHDHSGLILPTISVNGLFLGTKAGDRVWRMDNAALCEQMLDRLLRCTLSTKPGTAKAYVSYNFHNGATANNGIATWSGANWVSEATRRSTSTAAEYYQQYFVGDAITIWQHATLTSGGSHAVTLDGAAHGTWNQAVDLTYSITGLSYGVHVVRVTCTTGALWIASPSFNQWPYQPCGGSGDAVMVEYVPWYICATTIGTSTTDNLAAYPKTADYGETITPRLPCSTAQASDLVVLRDGIGIIGGTVLKPGLVRLPSVEPYSSAWFRPGQTITLGSGGAVRGCRPAAFVYAGDVAPNLSASIIKVSFTPFIGRITAVGNPTNFTVGELVFGIAAYSTGAANVYVQTYIAASTGCAVDFCKIPADLL